MVYFFGIYPKMAFGVLKSLMNRKGDELWVAF